jgi:hypothetical protein
LVVIDLSPDRPDGPAVEGVGGFLQLCSDRRYHRKVMAAFERATGLASDAYYVEARPGGAASWADKSRMARIAYRNGARFMGWAGHGDRCFGFYGASNNELRRKLERAAKRRAEDFPRATHFLLFGEAGEVEVRRLG